MKVVVTAKVKLADGSQVLDETMRVYIEAVQFCIDTAWQHHIRHKIPLYAHCYYALRERFGLHAQLCCNVLSQSLEMVKKARSKPEFSEELSVRYNFPAIGDSLNVIPVVIPFSISFGEIEQYTTNKALDKQKLYSRWCSALE